jgi:hypothetical protein
MHRRTSLDDYGAPIMRGPEQPQRINIVLSCSLVEILAFHPDMIDLRSAPIVQSGFHRS